MRPGRNTESWELKAESGAIAIGDRLGVWFNRDVQKTLRILVVLLAVLGAVVSALALQVHYSNKLEPCDINAHWDCGIVNHSRYSSVAGVPVAAVGIAGYLLIGLLALLRKRDWTLAAAVAGLCYALYLSHVEDSILQVWCLYCVISQCIIALIVICAGIQLAVGRKQQSAP